MVGVEVCDYINYEYFHTFGLFKLWVACAWQGVNIARLKRVLRSVRVFFTQRLLPLPRNKKG